MTSTLPSSISGQLAPVSLRIRERLEAASAPFLANDNIAEHLLPGELEQLEIEVAGKVRELLRSLVIDIDNDHNTEETAERVARMYIHEVFKGRYHEQPKIASFPNVKKLDEIYTVGPIWCVRHALIISCRFSEAAGSVSNLARGSSVSPSSPA